MTRVMWMKQERYVRIQAYDGLSNLPTPQGIKRNVYVRMYISK